VFTTAHGGFIEPRNANRLFHDLCEKANVPQLRVHDLRHSCATLLFTMGVTPATVQRILRHTSITVTTGTYVEVIEAVQRDALDSMGTLLSVEPETTPESRQLSSELSSVAPSMGHDERVLPGGAKSGAAGVRSCRCLQVSAGIRTPDLACSSRRWRS
jgi:Phage integrase family